jgi:glutamate synthase (NADPH/NADH) small chain
MGKITGFMDYERIEEGWACHRALSENYKEFVINGRSGSQKQSPAWTAARPFCNSGCPVNNIIPTSTTWCSVRTGKKRDSHAAQHQQPEFTGRIYPALCGSSLRAERTTSPSASNPLSTPSTGHLWSEGWVTPVLPKTRTPGSVAVKGSGLRHGRCPAATRGTPTHAVRENDRVGGLLRIRHS